MSAALRLEAPDSFAAVRALKRMRAAGFVLSVESDGLAIVPASRLSAEQRAFIASHKAELVSLLNDADTLLAVLQAAGATGLTWREGTPAEWPDTRLLAAGEVLYADGRMVSVCGRRYLPGAAPWLETAPEHDPTIPIPPRLVSIAELSEVLAAPTRKAGEAAVAALFEVQS